MEEELLVENQRIRFDREITIALYREMIAVPGADQCGCIYCRNFAAQRSTVYPEEFLLLLKKLGADPLKEWEAFDYESGSEYPRNHLYGGWFVFSGELVQEGKRDLERQPFSYWFTTNFPNGTLPKDVKVCAIEFVAVVPWILSGSY